MVTLDDFESLKRKVEKLRSEADKAEGAYDQCMERLKEEFGVKTLPEAESLLLRFQDDEQAALVAYNKAKRKFERIHSEILKGV